MNSAISIDSDLLLLLVGCLYILVFGGLSFLRREGLSLQLALEAIVVTALTLGLSRLANIRISPILLLILLYLITMRSRLLVDVANLLAERGKYKAAFSLYGLSLAWWPDTSSRLIVLTNRGTAELFGGQVETAVQTLEGVLAIEKRPRLGLKYEAGCRYNLGLAYAKKGDRAKAVEQLNEVIDLMPGSRYAQAARATLKRWKETVPED
jgi:tetratricopeptide (TPR) repeat protein